SWLYQCTNAWPQARAASKSANPRVGNSGRYFAVLNSDSTKALSSDTLGLEYDGFTPSQWSMARTVVALSVLPLSPCRTGLSVLACRPSASAVRLSKCAA